MKLVIIGGVAAGMSAALEAKRVNPDLAVTVYEASHYVNLSACGLPYVISGALPDPAVLASRGAQDFKAQGINVFTRHLVTDVDYPARQVRVKDLDSGRSFSDSFDQLLLATGAKVIRPELEGGELPGLYGLRNLEDAQQIQAALARGVTRAVIVGGGYIGLMMADALTKRGLKVTVVEQLPRLLGNVDTEVAALALQELERNGVEVALQTEVTGLAGNGRVERVITSRGELPADFVLLTTGVRPNADLAAGAGVDINPLGAVRVNDRMETNLPGIFAAGDLVEVHHLVSHRPAYIPLGSTATKQGRVAGINIAGGEGRFAGVVGTTISKTFDLAVGLTGLSELEAAALDIPSASATIADFDHAPYYPDRRPLTVKLVFGPGDGRLLGAQIAGYGIAVKRIDVIATLLHRGGTIEDLSRLDLAYAAAFSPVLDPLILAANRALSSNRRSR